jgi:hypothetical protein
LMGTKLVKITTGRYLMNRIYRLPHPDKTTFLQKQERNYCNHYCREQSINIEKITEYLLEEIRKIAENSASKLSNYNKIIENARSSFIHARRSVLAESSLRLSQVQCIDMILPALV